MTNTIDATAFSAPRARPRSAGALAFIGTTHVDANRDGLRWFMREVFPLVRRDEPGVALDIVGGDPRPTSAPSARSTG